VTDARRAVISDNEHVQYHFTHVDAAPVMLLMMLLLLLMMMMMLHSTSAREH